jgi:hypothetical protein
LFYETTLGTCIPEDLALYGDLLVGKDVGLRSFWTAILLSSVCACGPERPEIYYLIPSLVPLVGALPDGPSSIIKSSFLLVVGLIKKLFMLLLLMIFVIEFALSVLGSLGPLLLDSGPHFESKLAPPS